MAADTIYLKNTLRNERELAQKGYCRVKKAEGSILKGIAYSPSRKCYWMTRHDYTHRNERPEPSGYKYIGNTRVRENTCHGIYGVDKYTGEVYGNPSY